MSLLLKRYDFALGKSYDMIALVASLLSFLHTRSP